MARTGRHIRRQLRIARAYGLETARTEQPGRLAKLNVVNCGNPGCPYCCNPRTRGELTMQEKRDMQRMRDGYDGFIEQETTGW
jgi:hypothetical protein